MATVYPFRALRPGEGFAADVASVPYDVVNTAEARALAQGNARSFLHVTRPDIDLADDMNPYGDEVYAKGAAALRAFIDDGTLVRDDRPCLYIYSLTMHGHTQTGVVLCASVADYDQNRVKKHELTRPDKENDRAHHIEVLGAQSGTVFLVHRNSDPIEQQVREITSVEPPVDFAAPDGIRHRFWVVDDPARIDVMVRAFDALGPIYVADGHHRSAAASRVAARRRKEGEPLGPDNDGFLAVSFPVNEMRILPYNRVVRDLVDFSASEFLTLVEERFDVTEGKADPIARHAFGMYLEGKWYTLGTRPGSFNDADPVERLDVSILQSQLLEPLLGIKDPRRDKRVDFVGGIRGHGELEKRCDNGWAVAFAMHATSIEDLLAIADANGIMPPKSTWFEPKLRDGLFVHLLD